MRLSGFCVSVCLALGTVTVVAAPAAATDSSHALPIARVHDVLVDDAHGHVFVTAGPGLSSGVLVRDMAGNAVTTITNQPGASGMVLSPDGTRLYVALPGADAIAAIDTTTLTEVARYETGATTCPATATVTETEIWFGYGCSTAGDIGVVNLAGETPAVTLARTPDGVSWPRAPRVETAPSTPGRLFALAPGAAMLYAFDVASGSLMLAASHETGSGFAHDLALTPDGAHVAIASGDTSHSIGSHHRYRTSDVEYDGTYGSGYGVSATAIAVAATGHVAGAIEFNRTTADLFIYTADGVLRRNYQSDCCNAGELIVRPGGVALSADASRVYLAADNGTTAYLQVHEDPTMSASYISLLKPSSAKVKASFTITGSLYGTVPVPGGMTLQVSRSSKYGTVARPTVTTAPDGKFSVIDTVPKRGSYTYTVSWNGDAEHVPVSRSLTFTVVGLTPSLSIATNASTYSYGVTARVLVRLGTTAGNRTVTVRATPYGYPTRVLASGTVSSDGYFRTSRTVTRKTTFEASFAGDEVYEPRKVSRTVSVRAKVTQSVSGYYTTSNGYYLFRRTVDPKVKARVTPIGSCLWVVADQYIAGAWRRVDDSECLTLDENGYGSAVLIGDPVAGRPYRIRSHFGGNYVSAPSSSSYLYLTFT